MTEQEDFAQYQENLHIIHLLQDGQTVATLKTLAVIIKNRGFDLVAQKLADAAIICDELGKP